MHHSQAFEVNPLDPNDLGRSVRCGDFECRIGETRSQTSFTYSAAMAQPGLCAVNSVHVKVETTITTPHWKPPGLTSTERRNWWAQLQTAVTRHEQQHVSIAEEGGKAIADSLMHLTGPSCMAVRQIAPLVAQRELQRVERRQLELDRLEGTLWMTAPPPETPQRRENLQERETLQPRETSTTAGDLYNRG